MSGNHKVPRHRQATEAPAGDFDARGCGVDAYHGRGVVVAEFKLDVAINNVFPSKNWRALACQRPHAITHTMHAVLAGISTAV